MSNREGEVEIVVGGKRYVGFWETSGGMIYVSHEKGRSKTTQLGRTPPESSARVILAALTL